MATKSKPEPKKRGRPSKYTPELAAEICARLAKGETLTSICLDESMPEVRTVSDWKATRDSFSADFARAREAGFDAIADECVAIADDSSADFTESEQGPAFNAEHVQRSKLRVETRLKLLAKWDPKRYGEKSALDLSNSDGSLAGLVAASYANAPK